MQGVNQNPHETQEALFRISLGADAKKLLLNQPVPKTTDTEGNVGPMDEGSVVPLLKMMETAVLGETYDTYEFYVFFHPTEKDSETIDEFLTELNEITKYCDMCGCMKDRLLKGQIITGIPNASLQEKLLQERELTLKKCIDRCCAAESAASQVKDRSSSKSDITFITSHRVGKT